VNRGEDQESFGDVYFVDTALFFLDCKTLNNVILPIKSIAFSVSTFYLFHDQVTTGLIQNWILESGQTNVLSDITLFWPQQVNLCDEALRTLQRTMPNNRQGITSRFSIPVWTWEIITR
jgi:hypothetical protein